MSDTTKRITVIEHESDCWIHESDICDCGSLRRYITDTPHAEVAPETWDLWHRHGDAIESTLPLSVIPTTRELRGATQ
jgi:hypothetical protein